MLEKFASVLGKLPLEKCTIEQNSLTGEKGWRAPRDHVFKITGRFILNSTQSDITDWCGPNSSVALLKVEYPDRYRDALEEAEGNKKRAWRYFLEDIEGDGIPAAAPDCFIGKWLVVSPNLTESLWKDSQMPDLMVKSEVEAWYERDFWGSFLDIAPDSDIITSCIYYSNRGVVEWKQYYAEAILGHCQIALIDLPDEERNFSSLEPANQDFLYPDKPGFWVQTERRTNKNEQEAANKFMRDNDLGGISISDNSFIVTREKDRWLTPPPKGKIICSKQIPEKMARSFWHDCKYSVAGT